MTSKQLETIGSIKQTPLTPLGVAAIIVLVMWSLTPLVVSYVIGLPDWQTRGQFGDTFGAINALFSGLAFSGLIYTVHLQRQELSLQRRELEMTRGELKRSAAAQEASEKALTKQALALESAAVLNALTSVIEHYPTKIARMGSAAQKEHAVRAQDAYIARLEEMLQIMSESKGKDVDRLPM